MADPTPREIAEQIEMRFLELHYPEKTDFESNYEFMEFARNIIEATITAAVEAETEACAEVAEDGKLPFDRRGLRVAIAAAIRARANG